MHELLTNPREMKRPEVNDYYNPKYDQHDFESYSRDLGEYCDHLESRIKELEEEPISKLVHIKIYIKELEERVRQTDNVIFEAWQYIDEEPQIWQELIFCLKSPARSDGRR